MKKEDLIRKLTSRKFILALTTFVTALILFCGGTQETAEKVTTLIIAGGAVVAYILAEGWADANGAATVIDVEEEKPLFTINDPKNAALLAALLAADKEGKSLVDEVEFEPPDDVKTEP